MDRAAQEVVDRVTEAQVAAGGGASEDISFGDGIPALRLHRVVSQPVD
jgi:hypothetical protein